MKCISALGIFCPLSGLLISLFLPLSHHFLFLSPLSYVTHPLLSSSFIYKSISFSRLSNLSCPHISSASFCPRLSKEFFNNRMLLHNSDHYANLSFIHSIKKKKMLLCQGQNKSPVGEGTWQIYISFLYNLQNLFF